jgi:hypothetical protein
MKPSPVKDLFASAEKVLGQTPDDADLQALLKKLGKWPLPYFGPEELTIYIEDHAHGFCLTFDDSSGLQHPVSAGKKPGTPIFVRAFFYAEGVDEYHAYKGPLPKGMTWSDTAASMVAKMGVPKHEIKNKKTGQLSSHVWPIGSWMFTARYTNNGASINHVVLAIF